MIRLSGTAADAAGAGQLQGSSGFGRRSLFRARRDGPDVPEKPVRRCFGQKVPGNGWAFANFFYLWRSKQYAMMDLKTIRAELRKLTAIVDGWEPSGEIPALERDLALEKLRTLYDAVRFTEVALPITMWMSCWGLARTVSRAWPMCRERMATVRSWLTAWEVFSMLTEIMAVMRR